MIHTNAQEKAAGAINTNGLHTDTNGPDFRSHGPLNQAQIDLVLTTTTTEARIDSRLLARELGNKHRHSLRLIDQYRDRFERFGKVCFKNAPLPGSKTGQSERYALLTEDQSYLLLSLSRNTDIVVNLKVKLIRTFGQYRKTADLRKTEYLPAYHQLHDQLGQLALGSPNERRVHQNVNRLLNKFAGIEAGRRATAPLPEQAMLIVGHAMAARAAQGATDHHDGYQRIKSTLQALAAITAPVVLQ